MHNRRMGKPSKSAKPAAKAVAKPAAKPAREPPAGTRAALIAASARLRTTFPAFVPPSTGGSEASDSTTAKEVKSQRRSASIAMREQLEFRKSGGMVAAIAAETDVGSGAAQMDVVAEEAEDAEEAEEDNGEAEMLSAREKKAEALCRIQCWCRRRTLRRKWADRVSTSHITPYISHLTPYTLPLHLPGGAGAADGAARHVLDAQDEKGKGGGQGQH
jgi:hypothetical protein